MRDLYLYEVNPDYLKYLHNIEKKVSVKFNNRPFVGVITMINGIEYLLPLTSQTTSIRKASGKKKRSSIITTFIRDTSGLEISNILHNNMIPVRPDVYTMLNIQPSDTYEANEIRFIRKNQESIIAKAQKVHDSRISNTNRFLSLVCCDFQLLERHYMGFST